MPNPDWSLVTYVATAFVTTAFGVWLGLYWRRARVVTYTSGLATFRIRGDNPLTVYSHSLVVRNAGKRAANNVRIGHSRLMPASYNLDPPCDYRVEDLPDDRGKDLVIPILRPREMITVSYLYDYPSQPSDIHTEVKHDEGLAREVQVFEAQQYRKSVYRVLALLIYIGLGTILYFLIKAAMLLVGWLATGG